VASASSPKFRNRTRLHDVDAKRLDHHGSLHVGDDPTKSFVDLYDHVNAHLTDLPPGASQPKITPLSVDDIPIVVLTLHGANYDRGQLDQAAQRLIDAVKPLDGVAAIATYGGRPREVNVTLDPVKLAAFGLSPPAIARALGATNVIQSAGTLRDGAIETPIHVGTPFQSADQVAPRIVGVSDGQPIALSEVASVEMGWTPEEDQTRFGFGGASAGASGASEPAVSVAIAKKPGTNAVRIAKRRPATRRRDGTASRNHGNDDAKRRRKSQPRRDELIERLGEAIVIVVALLLVWLASSSRRRNGHSAHALRDARSRMLAHQTINRITLFA